EAVNDTRPGVTPGLIVSVRLSADHCKPTTPAAVVVAASFLTCRLVFGRDRQVRKLAATPSRYESNQPASCRMRSRSVYPRAGPRTSRESNPVAGPQLPIGVEFGTFGSLFFRGSSSCR